MLTTGILNSPFTLGTQRMPSVRKRFAPATSLQRGRLAFRLASSALSVMSLSC